MKKLCFGVIVGNRDFFPDALVDQGRKEILTTLEKLGYETICLDPSETKLGAVETLSDAKKCAKLFKENSQKIDGLIVTLPNFGDEKAIAQAIRMSELKVPVLVHAFADDPDKLDLSHRRDSFCGKISVCNNLRQFGIRFSLTTHHTEQVNSESFRKDIEWFAAVCRVVNAMKRVRIGAIGARPNAFNTVRFSEKILEQINISVETVDLSEIIFRMNEIKDSDERIQKTVQMMRKNYRVQIVPDDAITTMAKLFTVIDEWTQENDLNATAIQCWTIIEKKLHIAPCTVMSMMSEKLKPSACEVDVTGALSMYVLQIASGKPSAIVDWNNNYVSQDQTILFHCGNFPSSLYETVEMRYADVIGTTVGNHNAYGACAGKIKSGPFTFLRLSTDDINGTMRAYVGEGEILSEDPKTFGSRGIARINNLDELMNYICLEGFEHHVAINLSQVAKSIKEAFERYMNIKVHLHQ
ncbi:MAG TPA: L-fucose/L-arabinose isomerase family protein [Pseudothermotoga sp.]|nr:L-fucose/L-arabinose isomerase family protein [Pseudothermotoga sp.]HOK84314.1 L-fucose/L-arabinose isomerase family protein [Pseudothermotoga sp.]HPP70726.1 L-fucose/L-arabinose isomerase family protein [Pseudothermotoga sp.]